MLVCIGILITNILKTRQQNIANIYVSIFVSIILFSYLCYEKKISNIQCELILTKRNFLIHNIEQELFMTTMLAFWFFIICLLNILYFEVIADIKCYIWISITVILFTTNTKKRFPKYIYGIFGNFQHFSHCSLQWSYSWHTMSVSI